MRKIFVFLFLFFAFFLSLLPLIYQTESKCGINPQIPFELVRVSDGAVKVIVHWNKIDRAEFDSFYGAGTAGDLWVEALDSGGSRIFGTQDTHKLPGFGSRQYADEEKQLNGFPRKGIYKIVIVDAEPGDICNYGPNNRTFEVKDTKACLTPGATCYKAYQKPGIDCSRRCPSGYSCEDPQDRYTTTGICTLACNVCPEGTTWDNNSLECKDESGNIEESTKIKCNSGQACIQGEGCDGDTDFSDPDNPLEADPPPPPCKNDVCSTAIGDISTKPGDFVNRILGIILSLSGGIATVLIIISGYRLMISRGNPEQVQQAKEQLTAAIVGLLFVIFSLVILQVIGINILHIF